MKKTRLFKLGVLLAICLLSGCSKEIDVYKDDLPVMNRALTYDAKGVMEYTVAPHGDVIIYGRYQKATCEELVCDNADIHSHNDNWSSYLAQYDIEGNQLFYKDMDSFEFLTTALATDGENLYIAATTFIEGVLCTSLFTYDFQTDEIEPLYDFQNSEEVNSFLYTNGALYIITRQTYGVSLGTAVSSGNFVKEYASRGEKMYSYSIAEKKAYDIPIQQPITMALCEDGSLMINYYDKTQGFLMMKYDTQSQKGDIVAQNTEGKVTQFAVCNNDQSILYSYDVSSRGLVLSPINDWSVEAELHKTPHFISTHGFGFQYMKGHVYLVNELEKLERFSIRDVYHDYNTIQYISAGHLLSEPFGVGYTMKRLEMDAEPFVLKVLARDKDFDIAVMSSSNSSSYDISQAEFYPLNDIEGMEEYLEQCFPYVKEAATNREGAIWMLPVGIDIYGYLVDENRLESESVDLEPMMTYDDFIQVLSDIPVKLQFLQGFNPYILYSSIACKFIDGGSALTDYSKMRPIMATLQEEYKNWDSRNHHLDYTQKELLYEMIRNMNDYTSRYEKYDKAALRAYPLPKVDESDPNYGHCTFLVVNPESENIEEVKAYIADYIKFIMEQENEPLWFQNRRNTDPYWESVHSIYRNGKIVFQADYDVWHESFFDTIEGKMDVDSFIKDISHKMDIYYNE